MTEKQFKTAEIFKVVAPIVLKGQSMNGAFYTLMKVFPNIGAGKFERLRDEGKIARIPGTDQYLYASVLWDMLWHEEYEMPEFPEPPEFTPKRTREIMNGHDITDISANIDRRVRAMLERKSMEEQL